MLRPESFLELFVAGIEGSVHEDIALGRNPVAMSVKELDSRPMGEQQLRQLGDPESCDGAASPHPVSAGKTGLTRNLIFFERRHFQSAIVVAKRRAGTLLGAAVVPASKLHADGDETNTAPRGEGAIGSQGRAGKLHSATKQSLQGQGQEAPERVTGHCLSM